MDGCVHLTNRAADMLSDALMEMGMDGVAACVMQSCSLPHERAWKSLSLCAQTVQGLLALPSRPALTVGRAVDDLADARMCSVMGMRETKQGLVTTGFGVSFALSGWNSSQVVPILSAPRKGLAMCCSYEWASRCWAYAHGYCSMHMDFQRPVATLDCPVDDEEADAFHSLFVKCVHEGIPYGKPFRVPIPTVPVKSRGAHKPDDVLWACRNLASAIGHLARKNVQQAEFFATAAMRDMARVA